MFEKIEQKMRERAGELYVSGVITRVLAWEAGVFSHYPTPTFFICADNFSQIIFNRFCTANLSKYITKFSYEGGKTLIFLRQCDALSFAQLINENQIRREACYVIGIGCEGCAEVIEGKEHGLLEACRHCVRTEHTFYDEHIYIETTPGFVADLAGTNPESLLITTSATPPTTSSDIPSAATVETRFTEVNRIDHHDETTRYKFWQAHLTRCIRCNACRNICPLCYCKACILDNEDPLEKQHFHIIRAFHQSGRCTDCGQCARVCPQKIPLHLLNRKLIAIQPPGEVQDV